MAEHVRVDMTCEGAEEFAAKLEQARANVARYREEHGLSPDYTSGDADTGSLTEDEENELRWRHR